MVCDMDIDALSEGEGAMTAVLLLAWPLLVCKELSDFELDVAGAGLALAGGWGISPSSELRENYPS